MKWSTLHLFLCVFYILHSINTTGGAALRTVQLALFYNLMSLISIKLFYLFVFV